MTTYERVFVDEGLSEPDTTPEEIRVTFAEEKFAGLFREWWSHHGGMDFIKWLESKGESRP